MAAPSDEELESLLRNFDRVYQVTSPSHLLHAILHFFPTTSTSSPRTPTGAEAFHFPLVAEYKDGISKIQMLRSSYDAEIKRREALEVTCNSLKTERRSKFQQLKEELRKLQEERLSEEAEHWKAIEMLKQDHEVKIADLAEQTRCLLLQKQANEVTIKQLQQDMAACKMQMDVLSNSLQQVKIDAELKYYHEIQDLKDLLLVEQEEKNEFMKKLKIAEKELITCKTKQAEQQQELTSNRHVEILKQKIMKLRKENEVLKRHLTLSSPGQTPWAAAGLRAQANVIKPPFPWRLEIANTAPCKGYGVNRPCDDRDRGKAVRWGSRGDNLPRRGGRADGRADVLSKNSEREREREREIAACLLTFSIHSTGKSRWPDTDLRRAGGGTSTPLTTLNAQSGWRFSSSKKMDGIILTETAKFMQLSELKKFLSTSGQNIDFIDKFSKSTETHFVEDPIDIERREKVKEAMIHAWSCYEQYAWGQDELQVGAFEDFEGFMISANGDILIAENGKEEFRQCVMQTMAMLVLRFELVQVKSFKREGDYKVKKDVGPQTKNGVNSFGGLGATLIDSLDTLYIMGLHKQFQKAREWIANSLDFNKDYDASVFETTIRVVGGLLSAYDLSEDQVFLGKAKDIADRLLPAWDTPTGIPYNRINLAHGNAHNHGWTAGDSILADSGTEQLEFIALSQRTGDPKYQEKAESVITTLHNTFPSDGLLPIYINPQTGAASSHSTITFGAMGDREMWETSMKGLLSLMDELACFAPGMLALGSFGYDPENAEKFLSLAKELAWTCYNFYESTPTKLAGENYHFHNGEVSNSLLKTFCEIVDMSVGTSWNILRPETVESLMYLWRLTGNKTYKEWGWNIFQAFEKNSRIDSGYVGLRDVNTGVKDNMMQSFFLAETLKYLYLLFSPPSVISLDEWVFNTEAHPLRIVPRNNKEETFNGSGDKRKPPSLNIGRKGGSIGRSLANHLRV
ncbi:hypothetical protein ACLOJK_030783 [Asimina triloba]